ncbi:MULTISPECIES: right-handed parallel beta-helix repeat-containing protein [unclassified Leptolyngbya]|uniref:right-handed parallel beta-helix repeat-containing protein n=1 Tax=unclassified Leptolyngbya TaxID=2650499 RepID=UPI001686D9AE|nr:MULTISPECIES: right-handed parallel beta-helix repeat-containing protein [unclassified Leptolyngbya]MBD1909287.1 right-handed parallel beta-helix repeat-containing protein [Leptolyngbya sp. FACHB-8]MBD2153517.1 right-handed parallel beta-helix repeat-containing protein [Leptolyngbya sp. FACHB-16]
MKRFQGLLALVTFLAIALGCSATPGQLPSLDLQAEPIRQESANPYVFQVSYGQVQSAPNLPALTDKLRIEGPNGFASEAHRVSRKGNTLQFQVQAPGERWDVQDNGTYTVSLRQAETTLPIGRFRVAIAEPKSTSSENEALQPLPDFGATGRSIGSTYYVSPTGDDGNSGTRSNSPFRTAEKALSMVGPGDTVQFAAGTYEALRITGLRGEAGKPITLRGDRDALFTAGSHERDAGIWIEDSSQVILDGLTARRSLWGIMGEKLQHVTIRNCHVYDTGQEAVHVRDRSSHILIAENSIHDTGRRGGEYSRYGEGIYVGVGASGGDEDGTHHVLLHRNEIFRTSAEAIDLKRGLHDLIAQYNSIHDINTEVRAAVNVMDGPTGQEHDYVVRGNQIYNISGKLHDSDGTGIRVFGGGVEVYNNVVYNTEAYGIRSEGDKGGDRKIYYNTVFNGGSEGDIVDDSGKADLRNNIGASEGDNIPSRQSLFVDANHGDFRLSESATSAIDQGHALTDITTDIMGGARPLGRGYDLGAYENW